LYIFNFYCDIVLNFIVFFHILLYVCAFATFSLKAT